MFSHDLAKEKALHFSRFDQTSPFSSAARSFELEGTRWQSAEHYLYAKLARNPEYAKRITRAESAQEAYRLGSAWYRRKCDNWKSLRRVLMTRALYTTAMTYAEVKQALLDTGDEVILETSAYDHYWGIGRDQRGANTLGKIWQDIRNKIRADAGEA